MRKAILRIPANRKDVFDQMVNDSRDMMLNHLVKNKPKKRKAEWANKKPPSPDDLQRVLTASNIFAFNDHHEDQSKSENQPILDSLPEKEASNESLSHPNDQSSDALELMSGTPDDFMASMIMSDEEFYQGQLEPADIAQPADLLDFNFPLYIL